MVKYKVIRDFAKTIRTGPCSAYVIIVPDIVSMETVWQYLYTYTKTCRTAAMFDKQREVFFSNDAKLRVILKDDADLLTDLELSGTMILEWGILRKYRPTLSALKPVFGL